MRLRRRISMIVLAVVVLVALVSCATMPDWTKTPTYGSVRLQGGFLPDPHLVNLIAGGSIDLASLGFVGYVAEAPDFDLFYTPTNYQLSIYVTEASEDTVLLINDPAGDWYYSDDADNLGNRPGVLFPHPRAGLYDIWVGTYSGGLSDAVLAISEGSWARSMGPDWHLDPAFGSADLAGMFSPDPYRVLVTTGTEIDLSDVGYFGYCAEAPDFNLYFTSQKNESLYIYVEDASGDTVLLVNDTVGTWHFSDDAYGLDPGIVLDNPPSGLYNIWVGSLGGDVYEATLVISSRAP